MKQLYFLLCLFMIAVLQGQTTQNDSIYFWKSGALLEKRSIKTVDLNSITFKRPVKNLSNVTICSQVWATKNLDVTTYSDGTPIPQVTDPIGWKKLRTGAWCYYNNDPANGAVYGKLYNWYAAAGIYDEASLANPALRKKLAPTGWHVPTDAEWTTLTACLGGESVAGGKMKATGTTLWQTPNTAATNESGFTGLPGGIRDYEGTFRQFGTNTNWWSLLEYSPQYAYAIGVYHNSSYSTRAYADKWDGFFIRCLRD